MNTINIDKHVNTIQDILTKYSQHDSIFEDPIWLKHTFGSLNCNVNPGEIVFDNTVYIHDWKSNNRKYEIRKLLKELNDICDNIKVSYRREKDKENHIVWFYIVCVDSNNQIVTNDIGL